MIFKVLKTQKKMIYREASGNERGRERIKEEKERDNKTKKKGRKQ